MHDEIPSASPDAAGRSESPKRPSQRTLRGLDGLNFLLADVQTGVGPFLAIYLAGYRWKEPRAGRLLVLGLWATPLVVVTTTIALTVVVRLSSR
jgi:hypothetical protein